MKAKDALIKLAFVIAVAGFGSIASADVVEGHWTGTPVCAPDVNDPARTVCHVDGLDTPSLAGNTNDRFFFYYSFPDGQTLELGDNASLLQAVRFTKTPPAEVEINADFAIALTDRQGERLTDFLDLAGMRCYAYNTVTCSLSWRVDDPALSGASVEGVVLRANMRADSTIPIVVQHGNISCNTDCLPTDGPLVFEADSATATGSLFEYLAVAGLPDINADGIADVAVLARRKDGIPTVLIMDGATDDLVNEVEVTVVDKEAIGLAGLLDLNGNDIPEVAVLMARPDGRGVVQVRDALTGNWIGNVNFFNPDWQVKAITSQDSDDDGISEIIVMGVKDDGTAGAVQIIDSLSRVQFNWIPLPED